MKMNPNHSGMLISFLTSLKAYIMNNKNFSSFYIVKSLMGAFFYCLMVIIFLLERSRFSNRLRVRHRQWDQVKLARRNLVPQELIAHMLAGD